MASHLNDREKEFAHRPVAVVGAIAELKGSPKVLLPHVKSHVKVVEKDGEFVIYNDDGREAFRAIYVDGVPEGSVTFGGDIGNSYMRTPVAW